ncbi:AzlC family ABC transporter permease [Trinickia sp. LjRoot230]|uniref:AzlC family ABC transporter permease n=1 Tax=Trinickia sp. LjRoot230 TaxID=3342288 RepID=UPI003ECDE28B
MPARFSAIDRAAYVQGLRDCSPTVMALLSWGLVTGVAMSKSVLTVPQAIGMSLFVYAGSSQLAALPLLAAKLPIWTILLTAAMVNLRFLIFSAGLVPHFAYLPFWRRTLLGYFNGDIVYLLFQKRAFPVGHVPGKEAYFWGMASVTWASWQISSIAGIVLASFVPDNWGLELAGTVALVPLIVTAIVNRSTLAAVSVAGIVALLAIDLPYRLALPLAVMAALGAGSLADVITGRAHARRGRGEPASASAAASNSAQRHEERVR